MKSISECINQIDAAPMARRLTAMNLLIGNIEGILSDPYTNPSTRRTLLSVMNVIGNACENGNQFHGITYFQNR